MAEIDDLMYAAFARAAVGADAAVDVSAARQAVRGRIAAGATGPALQVAPGWRLIRWGFAAHRVAWTALVTAVAVAVAVLVITGLRQAGPVTPGEPGTGMTTPAPVSEPGPGSAHPATMSSTSATNTVATKAPDTPSTTAASPTEPSTTAPPATSSVVPPPGTTSAAPAPGSRTTAVPPRTTRTLPTPTTTAPPATTTTAQATSTSPSSTVTTRDTTTVTTTSATAADTQPPVILSLFATAQEVAPGQTVSIVAQVSDDVGVTGVRLAWSTKASDQPAGTAEMTPSRTGWVFTATVPKLEDGDALVFAATARDAAGNRSDQATVTVIVRR